MSAASGARRQEAAMLVVVIHGWQKETSELVQALAGALGIVPFEARQRLLVGNPAVVAGFAGAQAALALAQRLTEAGLAAVIVNSAALRSDGRLLVQHFTLRENDFQIRVNDGTGIEIPYTAVDLLLLGIGIVNTNEERTVTSRKFSIGKTLLAGGVPMTSKVTQQEEFVGEDRRRYLYLHVGEEPPLIFSQHDLHFEGLGSSMQLTREANFSCLLGELRQRCTGALYDDRLLNRSIMSRLLGPARSTGSDLDLAETILARTLRT
jgi:hypothetical protein